MTRGGGGSSVSLTSQSRTHSLVRMLGRDAALELVVGDDPLLGGVHEEHAAGLQASLGDDLVGRDVEDAGLGGHDDAVVGGDVVAGRAQAVAVERGADAHAVGEGDRGRAVPRLHQAGVELVEGPLLLAASTRGAARARGPSSSAAWASERPER